MIATTEATGIEYRERFYPEYFVPVNHGKRFTKYVKHYKAVRFNRETKRVESRNFKSLFKAQCWVGNKENGHVTVIYAHMYRLTGERGNGDLVVHTSVDRRRLERLIEKKGLENVQIEQIA